MRLVYESIGRVVVFIILRKFGRQLRVAGIVTAVAALAGAAIGAYLLASKDVEEG